MRYDSQRTDHTQHSKYFQSWNVCVRQHHINAGSHHNEEVKLVPRVAQVGAFIHSKAEGYDFEDTLEKEQVVEDEIELFRDNDKLIVLRQVNQVRL